MPRFYLLGCRSGFGRGFAPCAARRRWRLSRFAAAFICLLLLSDCRSIPLGLKTEGRSGAKESVLYGSDGGQKPENYALVSFFAYGMGTRLETGERSLTGHAFVSINDAGAWGFYPVPAGKPISKKSVVLYNLDWPEPVEEVDFFVDETVLSRVKRVINEWKERPPPFVLLRNDCVTFVYQICAVMGLRYSEGAVLPATAVRRIRSLNKPSPSARGRP